MRTLSLAMLFVATLAAQPPVKTPRQLSAEFADLNDRYAVTSARFKPSHPDIVTIKDKIALVRKDLEQRLETELAELKGENTALRLRYKESHPVFVGLAAEIKWHEQELQRLRPEPKAK